MCSYLQADKSRYLYKIPFIIDSDKSPRRITKEKIEVLKLKIGCVSLLLIYALGYREGLFPYSVYENDSNQFVKINRTSDNFGREMSDFFSSCMLSLVVILHQKT